MGALDPTIPYKTVFFLKVHIVLDSYQQRKKFFPYYIGNDMTNFRYPDTELLDMGIPLSDRGLM